METPTISLSISTVFLIWLCIYALKVRSKSKKIPPGPYPIPIIGNIFHLGPVFHVSLAELSKKYGPLMKMKLGSMDLVVVSSAEMAKQLLSGNDHQFVRRLVTDAMGALDHDKLSVIWMPALGRWRNMRKLCKERVFSSERLNASRELRQEQARKLSDFLQKCCRSREVVNVCEVAFTTSLNLISNTIFSVDFAEYGSTSSQEVKDIVNEAMQVLGTPNVADYLTFLKALDPQGIRRKAEVSLGKLFRSFDGLIIQRLEERNTSLNYSKRDDFLETLLDLAEENEAEWSHQDIKHLIFDLISAGTETTSVTVEWAMTELLRNPTKLKKARNEIKEVIGNISTFVQESDISRLPYLQAVVKETLRLHPSVTILGRQPEQDIEIDRYIVPKECAFIVNLWAIGRDPGQWPDAESFLPERFMGKDTDTKGHHFELLPFGTGRRVCLGMPLAHRMLHLMLAAFLQQFHWELEDEMRPQDIDLGEKFGITVQKALPLKAIPVLDIYIRKLSKERIFSTERLNASQRIRQEKVQELSDYLHKCCENKEVVNVCEAAFTTSLNLLSSTIFSVDFADYGSSSSHEMKEIVTQVMQTVAAPNVADILPVLKALDPQGVRRKVEVPLVKLLRSFDGLISQRLQERQGSLNYSRKDDFLETLLDLTEENGAEWSHQVIKHLIVDLILAGTETNANTGEWAMTELLKSPEKLKKAKDEIKEVLGDSTFIQESDISRLPYLQAIVKETLRLHPAATILVRQPINDIEINNYIVPKEAQIFINTWAIGRDPRQWPDPDSFVPERFLGKDIDMKGQHFELLPFGIGRRMCLGIALADRMLHLVLAAFLHGFDWKLEDGVRPEDVDMNERFGIVVQKALPLKAIPLLDYNVLNH